MARPLYGLMITVGAPRLFADWCRDQLRLYDAVVCLDGTPDDSVAAVARRFAPRLIYLRERDFAIASKSDHGLRGVVHAELVRRFGADHWAMCCHSDEFCYHDPRKVAALAESAGYDLVSWFSPHFYPHPSESGAWSDGGESPITERSRHYHWSYEGDGYPWAEDRLYRNGPGVAWDESTHCRVRPHGLTRAAPFHPILRHYKVAEVDPSAFELRGGSSFYRDRWVGASDRTGIAFPVRSRADFFVTEIPKFARCDRFDGAFPHAWNMGDEYCPDAVARALPDGPMILTNPIAGKGEGEMAKRKATPDPGPRDGDDERPVEGKLPRRYRRACRLAERGDQAAAMKLYEAIAAAEPIASLRALVMNDMAALAARRGEVETALAGFRSALEIDPACGPARLNFALLSADCHTVGEASQAPQFASPVAPPAATGDRVRVAILSFLFNWPSTGGGTVHTYELARFLQEAGYEVRHIYARHEPWGIGGVEGELPYPSEALTFEAVPWNLASIQDEFRRAVDAFGPDHVILTDSWNSKPLLAAAVRGYPTILRLQALETLCPLNNVRLLPGPEGGYAQCPKHQLADYDGCAACLRRNGEQSGSLHRAERALVRAGTPEYRAVLMRAYDEAEAVLVVNPLAAAMVEPYAKDVRVVTAGMDPGRFPWPPPSRDEAEAGRPLRLLFAGLVDEAMKGFDVLHRACEILWGRRRDFELVATADPPGRVDAFTRFVGWQSQGDLPARIYDCDVLVMPTVAQEALGRTAVEAMACGRPVVASRLGGLPFTVLDGATGLLCEPGDPADLALKIEALLDDAPLRERMGQAGRRRFEEHYAWPVLIERHYRPLLGGPARPAPQRSAPALVPRPQAYAPHIPDRVDEAKLAADAADFFGLARADVTRMLDSYRGLHEAKGYARLFGELKTLCFEEAFLIGLAMSLHRPRTIVEVGTQHGKSTRRLLDLAEWLGLTVRVVCLDTEDQVRHFASSEAELVIGDVTGRFRRDVLERYDPDLLFLDVHGHALLHEAIAATMDGDRAVLAVHDCGRGLCNPRMTIAPDDPGVTSLTGVWERHILAERFGLHDPLDPRLDSIKTATHRMTIFDTPHGLALIAPRAMAASSP